MRHSHQESCCHSGNQNCRRAKRVRDFIQNDLVKEYLISIGGYNNYNDPSSDDSTGNEYLAGNITFDLAMDYLRDRTVSHDERGKRRRRWRGIVLAAFTIILSCLDGFENPCGSTGYIMYCACRSDTTRNLASREIIPILKFCDWKPYVSL